MTLLTPIMLVGWVPLTYIFFRTFKKPHQAVLFSVIGGMLFLPTTGYTFSGFPTYSKETAIALAIIAGGRLSGAQKKFSMKLSIYDAPMIIWCLCPIATSLLNDLGLYDGVANVFSETMRWGVPYFSGRRYFQELESLRDLCLGLVIGGLLYAPLCFYEVRFSPQLNRIFYGFFAHDWRQHMRYGGYRPIVFMQHGLMVSLWMAISSVTAFWLWKSCHVRFLKDVPMGVVFVLLSLACVLCKSVNGIFAMVMGCFLYYTTCFSKRSLSIFLLLLVVFAYLTLRMNNIVTGDDLSGVVASHLNEERTDSFAIRLVQEDLYYQRALERPFFGWGGWGRGKPIDPETEEIIKIMIDSLWLITMRSHGFVGLFSLFGAMLIGPWLILRGPAKRNLSCRDPMLFCVLLSLIVVLFMVDSLLNGMVNSCYILISGALLSSYLGHSPRVEEIVK